MLDSANNIEDSCAIWYNTKKTRGEVNVKKKKRGKGTLIVVSLLLLLSVAGLYFGFIYPRTDNPYENTVSIEVPTVQASLLSAGSGEAHDVQANFTVEIDKELQGSVTGRALQGYITEIMSTLDYDEVIGEGSVEYVKSEVQRQLGGYLSEEQLQGVYITDLNTSKSLPHLALPDDTQRNKVFENLFPNSR